MDRDIMDIKMSNIVTTDGLHKSAIIYRDDSARFVYVCFHCGPMFSEINETLQHIESHFQLDNVVNERSIAGGKDAQSIDCFTIPSSSTATTNETVDIKIEVLEPLKPLITPSSDSSSQEDVKRKFQCKICHSIYSSKFLLHLHVLNEHIHEPMKCCLCKLSFSQSVYFENDLKRHIKKGDVSWKNVIDGIETTAAVDWSMYEVEVDHDFKVEEELQSFEVPFASNEKRSRPKETKRRVYSRPYRCHKCPLKCRYMNALRNHFQMHVDHELLKLCRCKECDYYYKNPYELRIHVLKVHQMMKTFSCNGCTLQLISLRNQRFEEHLEQHKLWTDITDGINSAIEDYSEYEEIAVFTEEQYSCNFCTQRFHLKSNLDVHMKSVHYGQRRLQCGQCDSVFTTPKYYFAHQLEHQRVGPIIVERDDNILLANLDACIDERIIYEVNEVNEQSFRCLICNVEFSTPYDIRSHIRERHVYKMFQPPMEPKKEFICDLCGQRLKTKTAIKNNLLIHTNTKTHACTICGKKFRQNADRKIHERQHTGEKPFICLICGKGFISNGLLTAHRKSHEDTTYPCPICGRTFNLASGYRRHVQTHNQERSFLCSVCPKSFTTRTYLTKHMAIHSNKQYQCRFCDSKFNTSDGQRQHERHKHKYASSL